MLETKPDFLSTMEREDIETKLRGRDYWACCPFHADKTPSFKVNIERQQWYCFSCNEGGDVITFIMKLHKLSFKDALVYLGIKNGKPVQPDPAIQRKKKIQKEYNEKITALYNDLCEQARHLHKVRLQVQKNPALTESGAVLFAQRMGELAVVDGTIDTIIKGDFEDHISLLKEKKKYENADINRRAA